MYVSDNLGPKSSLHVWTHRLDTGRWEYVWGGYGKVGRWEGRHMYVHPLTSMSMCIHMLPRFHSYDEYTSRPPLTWQIHFQASRHMTRPGLTHMTNTLPLTHTVYQTSTQRLFRLSVTHVEYWNIGDMGLPAVQSGKVSYIPTAHYALTTQGNSVYLWLFFKNCCTMYLLLKFNFALNFSYPIHPTSRPQGIFTQTEVTYAAFLLEMLRV